MMMNTMGTAQEQRTRNGTNDAKVVNPPFKHKKDYFTQQEAADFMGCSRSYLSAYLSKRQGFPQKTLQRQRVIPRGQLWRWLYGHPAGIAWRERWERLGRLNRLEW